MLSLRYATRTYRHVAEDAIFVYALRYFAFHAIRRAAATVIDAIRHAAIIDGYMRPLLPCLRYATCHAYARRY